MVKQSGTVSVSGTTVTGTGTAFTTEFSAGERITFGDSTGTIKRTVGVISSITSDAEIILTASFDVTTETAVNSTYKYPLKSYVGNDSNDGTASDAAHALATITKAISLVPEIVNGYVVISIAPNTYNEDLDIRYVNGCGRIHFAAGPGIGWPTPLAITVNYVYAWLITPLLILGSITCADWFDIEDSTFAEIGKCCTIGGCFYMYNTTAKIDTCEATNCDNAINATNTSHIWVKDCTGTGNTTPLLADDGGIISIEGTVPTGSAISEEDESGKIIGLKHGTTAERPAWAPLNYCYIDDTIGKPIWCTSTGWMDATGTGV
jgi:hypothetical protein